jgi:hypothetical protein
MSYDIKFKVKVEGANLWIEVGNYGAGTTWNVREMIVKSTGLEWKNNENNGLCKDVIPYIRKGYEELVHHPEKYRQYEPNNGWGTVESTRLFFQTLLEDWQNFQWWEDPKLIDLVTFWIE